MLSRKNIKFLTNLKIILANNFFLNLIFAINIFSMAGIPPLAGFFIKFDVLYYVLYSSNFYLTFFILLITVINFFYYLRLIKIVYFESIN
jgi:NADH:ubiquinone oxidoreductase subunit 2 (subunit N)